MMKFWCKVMNKHLYSKNEKLSLKKIYLRYLKKWSPK